MFAPSPAPDCTITLKPSFASFGTTSGTVATRFSPGKTSRGTPMTCAMLSIPLGTILLATGGAASGILSGQPSGTRQEEKSMNRVIAALVALVAAMGLATGHAQDKK